ncbi:4-alpha-glucanotransferase [Candidatus Nitronereus thalassa]|uniref:4-alpha-glucanotransferase n=1 Tax=Candidatus Nitronereus thalassa TaxID=3020898 RepID=UPI0030B9689F
MAIIAKDLGTITPEIEELRDEFEFPGIKVLPMAFGHDPKATTTVPISMVPMVWSIPPSTPTIRR